MLLPSAALHNGVFTVLSHCAFRFLPSHLIRDHLNLTVIRAQQMSRRSRRDVPPPPLGGTDQPISAGASMPRQQPA